MRTGSQPGSLVGPDSPKPGRDGSTRWNASAGSGGLVSGSMTSRNSTTEPGQPWVITSGNASACGERTWMRWTCAPSTSVMSCGSALSSASAARQSYPSAQ